MARNGFRALPMPRAGHKSRRSFQLRNVSYAHDVTWLPLLWEMFFGGERLVVRSVLSEQRVPQLKVRLLSSTACTSGDVSDEARRDFSSRRRSSWRSRKP
jgi:hypothetical protein